MTILYHQVILIFTIPQLLHRSVEAAAAACARHWLHRTRQSRPLRAPAALSGGEPGTRRELHQPSS
jgi:hypothetical protein